METIGFLELNSIAKGMEVADCVLKTAEVKLVFFACRLPRQILPALYRRGCGRAGVH